MLSLLISHRTNNHNSSNGNDKLENNTTESIKGSSNSKGGYTRAIDPSHRLIENINKPKTDFEPVCTEQMCMYG